MTYRYLKVFVEYGQHIGLAYTDIMLKNEAQQQSAFKIKK
jgi:hypothetical protein